MLSLSTKLQRTRQPGCRFPWAFAGRIWPTPSAKRLDDGSSSLRLSAPFEAELNSARPFPVSPLAGQLTFKQVLAWVREWRQVPHDAVKSIMIRRQLSVATLSHNVGSRKAFCFVASGFGLKAGDRKTAR